MMRVTVDNLIHKGWYGGAIFDATCEAGLKHRIKAEYHVMPRVPFVGEVWSIDGTPFMYQGKKQLSLTHAMLERPTGRLFIDTVSKSEPFRGIGPSYATGLYTKYGDKIYHLLEKGDPEPFVEAIGQSRAHTLVNGWNETSVTADVYQWLDRNGIEVPLAKKLVSLYGDHTIEILEENPYRLLAYVSWDKVDRLARSSEIVTQKDDPRRLVGAIDATVFAELKTDSTWAEEKPFLKRVMGLLHVDDINIAKQALDLAEQQQAIIRNEGGIQGFGPWSMENFIIERLKLILSGTFLPEQMSIRNTPDAKALDKLFQHFKATAGITLSEGQKEAVKTALIEPVGIISGGPGVGKTTILKPICEGTVALGGQVFLMALSGRAARRMSEATGREAMTIARFLNRVDSGEISLKGEPTIVLDECSMIDLPTMYRTLRRLEPGCRLLMVGDSGQLPPISFGLVFHELVKMSWIPKETLTQIHRAAASSGIPQFSLAIRRQDAYDSGREVPEVEPYTGKGVGVSFLECDEGHLHEELLKVAIDLGGFNDVRILTALKGDRHGRRSRDSSAGAINTMFHSQLAAGKRPERHGFALNEPVIWMENNYEHELMNGTLGFVNKVSDGIEVFWDDGKRIMNIIDHMEHAYAITIHKSQGSQFKRVIIPVFFTGRGFYDSTMLYTAVTRAQEQVVLIGCRKTFAHILQNPPRSYLRKTGMVFLV